MIILDTNVISALMLPQPDASVLKWLDNQPESSIWTTSITLMELRAGVETLPAGQRREQLAQELEVVLRKEIGGRYVSFDIAAAEQAATLMGQRKPKGRPGEIRDTMIAGIALASHATLATRNTDHFADLSVPVIDPWKE